MIVPVHEVVVLVDTHINLVVVVDTVVYQDNVPEFEQKIEPEFELEIQREPEQEIKQLREPVELTEHSHCQSQDEILEQLKDYSQEHSQEQFAQDLKNSLKDQPQGHLEIIPNIFHKSLNKNN